MFDETIHKAVISICPFVITFDSLESRVLGNAQCQSVFLAQFFQFGNHAVCDDGCTLGIETVHHCRNDFQLVLDSMGNEVGID